MQDIKIVFLSHNLEGRKASRHFAWPWPPVLKWSGLFEVVRVSVQSFSINNECLSLIMRVASHCHTQQHSEYDKDSGRSKVWRNSRHETANAENSRSKTQHLDLRRPIVQKQTATKTMTLHRAQHRF